MMWLRAVLLVLAPFTLALGLTLPVVRFDTLYIFAERPSLVDIVATLWDGGEWALAALVALLSIVLPVLKLVGIAAELLSLQGEGRAIGIRWLSQLSRWSLMDVLLVALVIVSVKTSGLAAAVTQPGLWFYTASAVIAAVLHALAGRARSTPG